MDQSHESDHLREARRGCENAFAGLVHEYTGRLHRFLCSCGAPDHDAEDVVQETWVKAHRHLGRYDSRYAFSTWLFTIARRTWISHCRKNRKVVTLEEEHLPAEAAPSLQDEAGVWEAARGALPERHYQALWMRYGEDLSPAEIAQVLETTEGNVRVLLHRARAALAETLTPVEQTATKARAQT